MATKYAGILESAYDEFMNDVLNNHGSVRIEHLSRFQKRLQMNMYDSSILFMGPNGNAKSLSALALAKYSDPDVIKEGRILYSYDPVTKFIRMLADEKNATKTIMVDEFKVYFNYKDSQTYTQKRLMDMIEFARENRIAIVGAANDVRRLNNNYRDTKIQIVIYILDRYDAPLMLSDNDQIKAYGAVLLGNPAIEMEDKFCLNWLNNIYSFKSLKRAIEALPTFHGYFLIEDIYKYLTPEEIEEYRRRKREGIKVQSLKMVENIEAREKEKLGNSVTEVETNTSIVNNLWNKFKIGK